MRRVFWIILTVFIFMSAGHVYAVEPFDGCGADKNAINTAIGCIRADGVGSIIKEIFRLGTNIAGGIAFLLILFGGFQILTSTGNPEKLNEGKELIASAVTGLLMILFSVFLLKFIGVDLLCIPGFGSC